MLAFCLSKPISSCTCPEKILCVHLEWRNLSPKPTTYALLVE